MINEPESLIKEYRELHEKLQEVFKGEDQWTIKVRNCLFFVTNKNNGCCYRKVDSKNIRKHKNDVFRLTELIDPLKDEPFL